jgi:hypothetical protein
MCQFEGDIVNSLYDAFIISWGKKIPNPPGLPCLNTPATSNREFFFGNREAFVQKQSGNDGGLLKQMDATHISEPAASGSQQSQAPAPGKEQSQEDKSSGRPFDYAPGVPGQKPHEGNWTESAKPLDATHPSEHANDPARELQAESERYDKENHMRTTIPINQRLNVEKSAEQTFHDFETDFAPFYLHSPHKPVPMALVNRQPQAMPGHHDVHNPQNAAWLQGIAHK